ncbi:MAG: hypothetical protein KGI41_01290 [Patescibacteria group bacterium]|nr:hypothetical protein [Patescibacteria group bacterium]MDE1965861.1 hypothetical protein [Patescibacteria group bacterium]
MSEKGAYAKAGVDVDVEAEASRIMYEAAKETFALRKGLFGEVVAPVDDFAGIRMLNAGALPADSFMSLCFDTAGTKVEIAERVGKHDTIAFDLFAMVTDDAVLRGGEPVAIGTNLDLKSLGTDDRYLPTVRELAKGYVAAAKAANVSIINGEIAQMGTLMAGYGDFPYHWGAAALWIARKNKLLTGREIQEGDTIVLLRENGFRCNGWSLVRKVFSDAYGSEWHTEKFGDTTLGEAALTPSVIYTRVIVDLHGGFQSEGSGTVHGVVHITGGGIPEKFGRVLRPSGLGATLTDLFDPPAITKHCQEAGKIPDAEAYRAWNMGQGMAVITPEPEKAIAAAKRFGIEAKVAGTVTKEPGVRFTSKGAFSAGERLAV